MKKMIALLLVVIMATCCLAACDNGGTEEVKHNVQVYTVGFNFNSETINQWKSIYLLDEDSYVMTVYALDSKDNTKVTADFYMAGKYTQNGNIITVEPGYGYTKALNGDTPIQMPISPDNGGFSGMYYAMFGQFNSFVLNADGTWTGNEGDAVAGEAVKHPASDVEVYTVGFNFNSETINQWKTIYLLDEDTYAMTVYALDSKDNTKVTADFYMCGSYTREGNTISIAPGYGFTKALNGDTPIAMTVSPDEAGGFSGMYYAMFGQFASFTVNEDGTWAGVE